MRLPAALMSALAICLLAGCHPTPPPWAATDVAPAPTAFSSVAPTPTGTPGALFVPPNWENVASKSFTSLTLHPLDDRRCLVLGSSPTQGKVMSNEVALLDCEKDHESGASRHSAATARPDRTHVAVSRYDHGHGGAQLGSIRIPRQPSTITAAAVWTSASRTDRCAGSQALPRRL